MRTHALVVALAALAAVLVVSGCGSGGIATGGQTVEGTWTLAPTTLSLSGTKAADAAELSITTGTLSLQSAGGAMYASLSVTDSGGTQRVFAGTYSSSNSTFTASDLTGTSGRAGIAGTLIVSNAMTGTLEIRDTGGSAYSGAFAAARPF